MITIKLSQQQMDTLTALLDAGVRASGLNSVFAAADLLALIQAAVSAEPEKVAKEEG